MHYCYSYYPDIPLPDTETRKELFEINLRGIKLDASINFEDLANRSSGYSGADINQVCRDASFMFMRKKLRSLEEMKREKGLKMNKELYQELNRGK